MIIGYESYFYRRAHRRRKIEQLESGLDLIMIDGERSIKIEKSALKS